MKTTGDDEEFLIPSSNFDIDNEFTTSNTTEKEEDEQSSHNYYDNIDNEVLQNEESTNVFEDNSFTPTTVTNKKKKQKKNVIPLEQREVLAYAFSPLTELIGENTVEYIFEMLIEDCCDEDTREIVCGILMEAVLSQCDIDEAVACDLVSVTFGVFDDLFDAFDTTSDPIEIPPTNTGIQPTPNTNMNTSKHTTRMPPKDQQVPVISNNNTNTKKKKKKQATLLKTKSKPKIRSPPKTKTTHEIKQPSVNVEEIQQYMLHLRNNSDYDKFPMNNITICTQIAECEVAYYKIRHTNPVLAEVDMEFYHSLPPVQVLLGEMTKLERLAMQLEVNNITPTTNTTTTSIATHTAD